MTTNEFVDQVGLILGRYQALTAMITSNTDPEQVNVLMEVINQELERTLDHAADIQA